MTRWVLLLRGVNVGGHRKVPMALLRDVLTESGCADVRTYLNSGNAVVSSAASAPEVRGSAESALATALGFEVQALVRSAAELDEVVAACPWDDAAENPTAVHVAFLSDPPSEQAVASLEPERYAPDLVVVRGAEAYLRYAAGAGRSALERYPLDRRLGVWSTARNWRSVVALRDLAGG